ncbi:MAG: type VI secretion system-associated FHA domain protein TagH [Rhodobacteraceae bacterium]|jgi:type VI secretion system protein ImpI|nr:type VI secretion system-associated FHA domain protein TagH [Paracoccaceae bacterium]
MTLTLRIENFDVLENGGPASITLHQKGCTVGRGAAMDWVLPDPARHISSHHFDISFRDGAYYLTDVSTNGTFLQGQRYRLDGPHRIGPGDRFTVGHYVVVAALAAPAMPRANPAGPSLLQTPPTGTWSGAGPGAARLQSAPVMPPGDNDPWASFGAVADPVNPLPPRAAPHRLDDVAQDFVPTPVAVPMPPPDIGSYPGIGGGVGSGFQPPPAAAMPAPGAVDGRAVLRAFCEGAGLPPEAWQGADAEALARDLGQVVRAATDEIMTMLQDRAAVKHFTKGGERTMRSATGNNPMKFLPDSQQAIEAMFLRPRDGFMRGPDGFRNALRDIRRHQTAVFAALQPSLAKLLSGLSPDEIEDSAGSGILGGASKGRFWDAYVERWDAKAKAGDNGMLDAFLDAFAKAYASAAGKADD